MANLKEEFFNYLFKLEHSKKTINDYVMRINQVCKLEGLNTWEDMEASLCELIVRYQEKNRRCVLPLKRLNGFLLERSFLNPQFSYKGNFQNKMCALTRSIDPNTDRVKISGSANPDYATPGEVEEFLGVDQRTLKRWRQKRIGGPDWEKIGGKIHYPLGYLEKYLEERKNK